jgi:hypothetical protein
MRKGISVIVSAADRVRLAAIVRDRNSPQKHVWRARIVLLTADGQGTNGIPARSARTRPWSGAGGSALCTKRLRGLTRDKTRPARIPPLPAAMVDRVVVLTNQAPPHAATHWTAPAMAKTVGISRASVRRIWAGQGPRPHPARAANEKGARPTMTHNKYPKVTAWLNRHRRFTFHFTPTSCSWANAVEGRFAKLTRQRRKRGAFTSIVELQAAIQPLYRRHQPPGQAVRPDQREASVRSDPLCRRTVNDLRRCLCRRSFRLNPLKPPFDAVDPSEKSDGALLCCGVELSDLAGRPGQVGVVQLRRHFVFFGLCKEPAEP